MPKIPRFLQKVFASNYAATPTGQIAKFGSLAAGGALHSGDPATIQSLPAWLNGWSSATVGSKSPTLQDFNAYQFVVTQQLAYLLQAGIPEYDATTTYYIGSFCQVAGVIYVSIVDNNTGNAVTNPSYFSTLKSYLGYATVATTGVYADLTGKPSASTACRAWCNFDGTLTGTNAPRSGYNVTSVTRNSIGDYTINFTSAMANATYCVNASNASYSVGGPSGTPIVSLATGSVRLQSYTQGAGFFDAPTFCMSVFSN